MGTASAVGTLRIVALAILLGGTTMGQSEMVIVKAGTKEYHRPGCEVVRDGKGVVALTKAQAEARGLKPHAACDPATAPAAEPDGKTPRPSPPVYVYTDGSRYYHRENCKRLGKDPKKVALEQAGKEQWPCPTCRPPIRKRSNRMTGASAPALSQRPHSRSARITSATRIAIAQSENFPMVVVIFTSPGQPPLR